jgi:hypothetical protein
MIRGRTDKGTRNRKETTMKHPNATCNTCGRQNIEYDSEWYGDGMGSGDMICERCWGMVEIAGKETCCEPGSPEETRARIAERLRIIDQYAVAAKLIVRQLEERRSWLWTQEKEHETEIINAELRAVERIAAERARRKREARA